MNKGQYGGEKKVLESFTICAANRMNDLTDSGMVGNQQKAPNAERERRVGV